MGQHGQRLNTGTCFSVSSDDKLVLFLFPRGTLVRSSFCLFLFLYFFFVFIYFIFLFNSDFLGWTRLHATWIKPEVVTNIDTSVNRMGKNMDSRINELHQSMLSVSSRVRSLETQTTELNSSSSYKKFLSFCSQFSNFEYEIPVKIRLFFIDLHRCS
jgi:hypothetical protein